MIMSRQVIRPARKQLSVGTPFRRPFEAAPVTKDEAGLLPADRI